jgi:NAD(P)-dependent dehydrogenase (short-subunit alcohol dehydrogenase family)
MEALNGAKTLQGILDATAKAAGGREAPPAPPPSKGHVAVASTRPDADALRSLLLDTVSERTGYPTEMLSLHAALEADLGIDSIKRVEILGAFRRVACPDVPEPPAWFMEALNGAKTLQGILEATARLGGEESASATDSPAGGEGDDLLNLLFAAVKRRTGRDLGALSLDAPLDQLGFDLGQRVAIVEGVFSAGKRPLVNGARAELERAARTAVTMRELRSLCARLGEPSSAPLEEVDDECPRCVPRVVDAPLQAAARRLGAGPVLLTGDAELTAACAQSLADAGCPTFVLSLEELSSRERAEQAVQRIRIQAGAVQGVLHLLPLRAAPAFPGIDRSSWQTYLDQEVRSTLFLLQAVAPDLAGCPDGSFCFLAATHGGGDFQTEDEARHPWRGGIAGLLKTAAKEWPQARFRAVDLDEAPTADELTRELAADGPVEIGYRAGQRLALEIELVQTPLAAQASSRPPWTEGVVLITGGARGITARVAEELARQPRCRLVLVGRSPLPAERDPDWAQSAGDLPGLRRAAAGHLQQSGRPVAPRDVESLARGAHADREVRASLTALRAAGAEVNYLSCDVRDADAFKQLLADVRNTFGPIETVIHGAGIIEDRLIVDKTADSFQRVLGTKLEGLLTMVAELPADEVNALAVFSSVSAYFGNPGQGDYAAANEILNRICRRLRDCWQTRVVAFNWGPWAGSGMVTPEIARQFAERGMGLVPVRGGCQLAWRELVHDDRRDVRVVCGPGDWLAEAAGDDCTDGRAVSTADLHERRAIPLPAKG